MTPFTAVVVSVGLGGDGHILDKAYSMTGIDTRPSLIADLLHGNNRRIHQGRNLGDTVSKVAVQLEACHRSRQDGC